MLKFLSKLYNLYIFLQTISTWLSLKPDVAAVVLNSKKCVNKNMSAISGATGQLENWGHKVIAYFCKNFDKDHN